MFLGFVIGLLISAFVIGMMKFSYRFFIHLRILFIPLFYLMLLVACSIVHLFMEILLLDKEGVFGLGFYVFSRIEALLGAVLETSMNCYPTLRKKGSDPIFLAEQISFVIFLTPRV